MLRIVLSPLALPSPYHLCHLCKKYSLSQFVMKGGIIISGNWGEPHTSGLQCKMCVYVCMSARGHIPKI